MRFIREMTDQQRALGIIVGVIVLVVGSYGALMLVRTWAK